MDPSMKKCLSYSPESAAGAFAKESETHKSCSIFPLPVGQSHRTGVSSVCDTAQSTFVTKPDLEIKEQK